jgi:hypothetical protein
MTELQIDNLLGNLLSLERAVRDCGGSVTWEDLKAISVQQLLLFLSDKHIRFIYDK